MAIKKKLSILLVGTLSICLFFAFGFQINVSGGISKEGGTANVSLIEPLRVAAYEAETAYSGLKTKDDEELEALQLAVDEANTALKAALEAGEEDEEVLDKLQDAIDEAEAALEEFEPGKDRIMYSHIIINSNNGGSFNEEEGNYSSTDGDELNFTFESKEGFDLAWLRVGNTKFATAEEAIEYIYSSGKKNLTVHAHFKKDKDYSSGITVEETGLEEDVEQGDENDDEKDNGKGKDKEKNNNGKKNKNK